MENNTNHIDNEGSKSVEVSFELTLKELTRGHFFTLMNSPFILLLPLLLAIYIVYQYYNGAFTNEYENLNQFVAYIPTLFLILIILMVFFVITPYNNYKKAEKRSLLNRTYRFTDQEMILENINLTEHIKWALIVKAVESSYDFLIFMGKSMSHPIPKSSFKSPEDIQKLRDLLREKLGSKAKLKS